jgi:caa(3)-type oxidase subunit IV
MSDNHSSEHAGHHIIPLKLYIINACVITVLMFLTVFVAKGMELPGAVNGLSLWIALAIAITKTACIMSIFMGVWWNTPLVKVFATGAWAWLLIFFAFTLSDVMSPRAGLGTPTTTALPGVESVEYMLAPGEERPVYVKPELPAGADHH